MSHKINAAYLGYESGIWNNTHDSMEITPNVASKL